MTFETNEPIPPNGTSGPAAHGTDPKPDNRTAIERAWVPLAPNLLLSPPPPRRWLLRHPTRDGHPCAPCAGDGLLPRGKAGLLVADGGVGKTHALVALAVSVVLGRPWFGHFHVEPAASRGRVLLVLAEEDPEEVHRRLYNVADAYELDADERRLVAERIVALPLAGVGGCRLVVPGPTGRDLVDSPELATIRRLLARDAGPEGWALVALDPYARLGPDDAETDQAAATRTMEAAESLTQAPGGPTVLLAHHVSLVATQTGALRSRGVTGIRNAARWEGTLRADGADVLFRQSKSNYSRPMREDEEICLVRGPGGVLRAPSSEETAARAARAEERQTERETDRHTRRDAAAAKHVDDLVARVVAVADDTPRSKAQLQAAARITSRAHIVLAVNAAVHRGLLAVAGQVKGNDTYLRAGGA